MLTANLLTLFVCACIARMTNAHRCYLSRTSFYNLMLFLFLLLHNHIRFGVMAIELVKERDNFNHENMDLLCYC
jgi:hypothetical protein